MEDTTMLDGSQPIFEKLNFTIIPNGLSEEQQHELVEDIKTSGGTVFPFDATSGRIEHLEEMQYIVSTTSDFPDYHRALDLMLHVVKPKWVEDSMKIEKPKNPRSYSPDPALIMSEVVLCCGDIPSGDKEAIEGGVIAMGGQRTSALGKQVTHLIALSMDDERCKLAQRKKLQLTIVLPHWFDDCLKVGRRISERPYTLPDPEILDVEAGAIPPTRASPQIRDATDPDPAVTPTPPPQLVPRAIKAFEGKKVKLGEDLGLGDNLMRSIKELISAGGGKVTADVNEAQIYVCKYREGDDYVKASQNGKDVGNLSWLYWMITHNAWTNPMRRLLHYPRPPQGIPGFQKYKISISSYTGEARVYLENLVNAAGAEFTKTFKQDNTHLITAHKNSEKCAAAEEWNVHVVSHLWLEESYAACREATLSDPRYSYFPSRTNLGEILGQTEVNRAAVEKFFYSQSQKPRTRPAAQQPNNVPASSVVAPRKASDLAVHNPPLTEKKKRAETAVEAATPKAAHQTDGKENATPGTTGSRGAKDRALSKLHDAAPDIAKFEKEMKRKGGVIHGGRHSKEDDWGEKAKKSKSRESTSSKRSIDEVDPETSEAETLSAGTTSKNKKSKKDKLMPIKYRMLVSKNDKWANNLDLESRDKAKLRELGLFVTDDFRKVDILCAPKAVRTKKFVAALACGPTIVKSSYLDFALKNNKPPPPENHLLKDKTFEKVHKFRLDEAVERAKANQQRLLKGWSIFCTDAVAGGWEVYRDIITANGGKCHSWKGRPTNVMTASKRSIDTSNPESQNQEEDEGDVLYLISEAKKSEFPNWNKFRELAKKHDMVPRIVRTDWLLFVAMAQYVHWDPKWELNEEVVNKGST